MSDRYGPLDVRCRRCRAHPGSSCRWARGRMVVRVERDPRGRPRYVGRREVVVDPSVPCAAHAERVEDARAASARRAARRDARAARGA